MKTWVKIYTESLHDRKIRKLSERDQLVFFKLVLLAGYEDLEGALPSIEDISLELYMKESEIKKSLRNLIDAGLLYQNEDNVIIVTNFEKRQNANMSDAERSKKYRDNNKLSHDNVTTVTQPSRNNVTSVTQPSHDDTEIQCDAKQKIVTLEEEEEKEEDKEKIREEKKREEKEKIECDANASSVTQKKSKRGNLKTFGNFENVKLSDDEYNGLCEKYGTQGAEELIRSLDTYIEIDESGKRRKEYAKRNHNLTLQNWANRDGVEKLQVQRQKTKPKEETWIERAERLSAEMNENFLEAGDVIDL